MSSPPPASSIFFFGDPSSFSMGLRSPVPDYCGLYRLGAATHDPLPGFFLEHQIHKPEEAFSTRFFFLGCLTSPPVTPVRARWGLDSPGPPLTCPSARSHKSELGLCRVGRQALCSPPALTLLEQGWSPFAPNRALRCQPFPLVLCAVPLHGSAAFAPGLRGEGLKVCFRSPDSSSYFFFSSLARPAAIVLVVPRLPTPGFTSAPPMFFSYCLPPFLSWLSSPFSGSLCGCFARFFKLACIWQASFCLRSLPRFGLDLGRGFVGLSSFVLVPFFLLFLRVNGGLLQVNWCMPLKAPFCIRPVCLVVRLGSPCFFFMFVRLWSLGRVYLGDCVLFSIWEPVPSRWPFPWAAWVGNCSVRSSLSPSPADSGYVTKDDAPPPISRCTSLFSSFNSLFCCVCVESMPLRRVGVHILSSTLSLSPSSIYLLSSTPFLFALVCFAGNFGPPTLSG